MDMKIELVALPVTDVDRAKGFYGSVFGWHLQTMQEMPYTIVMTTPVDEQTQMPTSAGAINGGLMRRSQDTPSPVLTIDVDSVDASTSLEPSSRFWVSICSSPPRSPPGSACPEPS